MTGALVAFLKRVFGASGEIPADAPAQIMIGDSDRPYGDRRGMVKDPWGNVWQVATRLEG